jgi:protein TonB
MEKIMFRETLLESSPVRRKSKRWPMATAFTVELLAGAFLVVLPLLYSGVLPVSAQPLLYAPISTVQVERAQHNNNSHGGGGPHFGSRTSVVSFDFQNRDACLTCTASPSTGNDTDPAADLGVGGGGPNMPWLPSVHEAPSRPLGPVKRSHLDEALLINKVEPIYPKIAIAAGIRGEVRLHAIIAKDGTIQSISVVSGHPLLVKAAEDAVRQWRYRPYVLNKEPVEVETFITVNFKQ